ncbi:hypothetical protein [Undibacter mobilis]|uniref:Uncharacterized protein n=1 Tax=Undibacter mobilis TaxID=2292256 RepID=A0A371B860_9BRAD|nr:hypothetical protein [Undibacter mobilis]RDV03786.1 hypothetical protein DXH78_03805 [Undibacter mobilis]
MDLSDREEFIKDVAREGLGGSLAIYAAAIFGVLALIAVPIYAAVAPQVYDNPAPEPLDPLLQGPIIGNRVSTPLPLSHLKPEILADPKYAAELNAKVKRSSLARHQTPHVARVREGEPAVAELPARRERSGFSLFGLFGG